VKTEFGKYGEVLDRVKRKLDDASSQIENELSRRRRAIDRKLRGVEQMPDLEAQQLLQIEEAVHFDEELDAAEYSQELHAH
jgi:DNA recombination protein RmuC